MARKAIWIGMIGIMLLLVGSVWGQDSPTVDLPPQDTDEGQVSLEPEPMTLSDVKAGGLLFRTAHPGLYLPAPTLETDVSIEVTGLIARAVVRQSFENPHDDWLEGIYVFPLPTGAAVDAMRLVVGERIIEGEIQERGAARKTYEKAKKQGKKASLVEQQRPNIFTTSVANIAPGERVDVVIEYQEDLRFDSGRFQLRFPMVVNPRYIPGRPLSQTSEPSTSEPATVQFSSHGWAQATDQVPDAGCITPPAVYAPGEMLNPVNLEVVLDAGFRLSGIDSPSHELTIEVTATRRRISPAAGQVPADRDFVLTWQPQRGAEPQAALFREEFGGETYLLLMMMPPADELAGQVRLPRETIFVIDTSGSMNGLSMIQAQEALRVALDRLPPEDHFNIIEFDNDATRLFDDSMPADPAHKAIAQAWLQGLKADGGTEMMSALRLALADSEQDLGLRQVVFITDGSVGNEAALFSFIRQNLGRSRLFTVGIGSAPNSHFMTKAAQFGGGTFTYIDHAREVVEKMAELFGKIENPMLSDIEVLWDDPEVESWPQRIADLYLGEPLVLAARSANGPSQIQVDGFRGADAWHRSLALDQAPTGNGIHRLWARKKISALMSSLQDGADKEQVRLQVVDLALNHHLVSRYTSLVAVDHTPERPADAQLKSRPLPVKTPAGWKPPGRLPRGGTLAELSGWLGLFALLGAAIVWRRGNAA